jgi:DNA-binding transcriptional ArsR family regulator
MKLVSVTCRLSRSSARPTFPSNCALRDAGVVESRRDDLYIYHRLSDSHVVQVLDAILGRQANLATRPRALPQMPVC